MLEEDKSEERIGTSLKMLPSQRDLIDRAAALVGKSRSAFIMESATRAAQDAVLDQTFLVFDEAAFRAFSDALENPPPANEKLRKLMTTPAPWDR